MRGSLHLRNERNLITTPENHQWLVADLRVPVGTSHDDKVPSQKELSAGFGNILLALLRQTYLFIFRVVLKDFL